jgi:hypothetical protein
MSWSSHHGSCGRVAFFAFNAFVFFITIIWETANTAWSCFHLLAFWWNDDFVLFHPWQWCIATLHAVELSSQIIVDVDFAFGRAQDVITVWMGDSLSFHFLHFAIGSSHAFTIGVSQISFLAEASNDAVPGADGAWMWIIAGGWASSAAGLEYFGFFADWWHDHHVHFHFALFFLDAFVSCITDVSEFASATWSTSRDTWADSFWIVACAIAFLTWNGFFIFTRADWWW